jgi:ELWxxDGT repeat protein
MIRHLFTIVAFLFLEALRLSVVDSGVTYGIYHGLFCGTAQAQSYLLAHKQGDSDSSGTGLISRDSRVSLQSVGTLSFPSKEARLIGRFDTKAAKGQRQLLRISRQDASTFSFSISNASGAISSKSLRLSKPVSSRYYALSGFDIDNNGEQDLAIVDVGSSSRYRWFIIQNPSSDRIRQRATFLLGSSGDQIEWRRTALKAVEFLAVRHLKGSSSIAIRARGLSQKRASLMTARWTSPKGMLIPVRITKRANYSAGIALYSPARRSVLFLQSKGRLTSSPLPKQRCDGVQAISESTSPGRVIAVELCADGRYFLVGTRKNGVSAKQKIYTIGSLQSPQQRVRRSDLTRLQESTGELSVPLAMPGGDGSDITDNWPKDDGAGPSNPDGPPLPMPTATPTPIPTLYPKLGSQRLLKDINDSVTTNDSGFGKGFFTFANGSVVFTAMNPEFGEELWVTHGTAESTKVLNTINPESSTFPMLEVQLTGNTARTKAFFGCSSQEIPRGLCVTDGTEGGTRRIGGAITSSGFLNVCDSGAYLVGSFGSSGRSLVFTDGVADLTLVKAIKDLDGASNVASGRFACAADLFYFSTTNSATGSELWMTDGTPSGTVMVHSLVAGPGSGYIAPLGVIGRKLVFRGTSSSYSGNEVWMYDPDASDCAAFDANTPTCVTPNNGLGKIGILKDIFVGPTSAGVTSNSAVTMNGAVYFQGVNSTGNGEVWVTDGTNAGTKLLHDYPGTGTNPAFSTVYRDGSASRLYFTATRGSFGTELHMIAPKLSSDCASTYGSDFISTTNSELCIGMIADMNPNGNSATTVYGANENGVFFRSAGASIGYYYWNNTPAPPTLYSSTVPADAGASANSSGLIFSTSASAPAPAVSGPRELWFSDGSSAYLLKDINDSASSLGPNNYSSGSALLNDRRFFRAWNEVTGTELWVTDGTESGTVLVKDINVGKANSDPGNFAVLNGVMYFSATTTANGNELWAYDPLATDCSRFDPTTLSATDCLLDGSASLPGRIGIVKDINGGASTSGIASLTVVNGALYFAANNVATGVEPWVSDGTTSGTKLILDFNNSTASSSINSFAAAGDVVIFQATTTASGNDLYGFRPGNQVDDASCVAAHGPGFFKSLASGCYARIFDYITTTPDIAILGATKDGARVFYRAGEPATGVELYVTDGTTSGTYLVKDILPGTLSGFETTLGGSPGAFGENRFVFTALDSYSSNGVPNQQIWITDGTDSGTLQISASEPGYNARALSVNNAFNTIYFFAGTATTGMELWSSNGTASGTTLVKDLCPGPCSGAVSGLDLSVSLGTTPLRDRRVIFRGSDGASGAEPVVSDGTRDGTYLIDLVSGPKPSNPIYFWPVLDNRIVIYASDNSRGNEPWVVSSE